MSFSTIARSRWGKIAAALILIAGVTVPVASAFSAAGTDPNCPTDGYGRDCNMNSIMYGGAYSKTEFLNQFDANKDRAGHTDLQSIYTSAGISRADFASANTVQGVVYKNGDVKVGDKVVATNTWSAGRNAQANALAKDGVYYTPQRVTFLSESIPAWVNVENGSFKFAVIMSCGNPTVSSDKPFGQIFKRVTNVTADPSQSYAADDQGSAVAAAPGDILKYQVRINNNGDGTMTGTTMTDNLPAGVELVSNAANRAITANFGTVAAGAAVQADITVKVTQATAGCIDNVASFTASGNQTGKDHAWICVTPKPTPTPTPSKTPTPTPTPSKTPTPTPTPSVTPTPTPTPSVTPTPTPTPSKTPTPTPTPSKTPTPTPTPSKTPTPTPTPSKTPTPTPTPSHSPKPTPSVTPTPTPTPSEEYQCGGLTQTQVKGLTYEFSIAAVTKNVTVNGYIFTIRDQNGSVIKTITTDKATNTAQYTFPAAGTYTVQGQVVTSAGTTKVVDLCSATIKAGNGTPTPTPSVTPTPTPECVPVTPAPGSEQKPEVCGTSTTTTPTLPDTGAASALGGVGGLGAIAYATRAYMMSRKSLVDSLRQR